MLIRNPLDVVGNSGGSSENRPCDDEEEEEDSDVGDDSDEDGPDVGDDSDEDEAVVVSSQGMPIEVDVSKTALLAPPIPTLADSSIDTPIDDSTKLPVDDSVELPEDGPPTDPPADTCTGGTLGSTALLAAPTLPLA
ncbi:hypothetical protein LPJ73_005001 [Coemansia sp. RSA 2703]|nr:hypothetical protein LPJ73_005001 [Coemansia sp. RSA 2703]